MKSTLQDKYEWAWLEEIVDTWLYEGEKGQLINRYIGNNAGGVTGRGILLSILQSHIEEELIKARIDTAEHLHRNQGAGLPKRDFDNDTDEYICDTYIPALKNYKKESKQ